MEAPPSINFGSTITSYSNNFLIDYVYACILLMLDKKLREALHNNVHIINNVLNGNARIYIYTHTHFNCKVILIIEEKY